MSTMTSRNEKTAAVFAHLQQLSQQARALLIDIPARRALIERYFTIDPSITVAPNTVIEATAITTNTGPNAAPPSDTGHIPAEWIIADNADPAVRLLYVHGGSWISGSVEGYRPMLSRLSKTTGAAILAIDYRLAPEHPYPAGLEDSVSAFLWMRDNAPAAVQKPSPDHCFIAGDSAGGNLALAALQQLRDNGLPLPVAAIALSPATDLTGSSPSMVSKKAVDPIIQPESLALIDPIYIQGAAAVDHPYISPLFGDYHQLPPLLLQVGDAEVLLDDSRRLAELAKQQGCDVTLQVFPGMPHVFQGFAPFLPEATQALDNIGEFVSKHRS